MVGKMGRRYCSANAMCGCGCPCFCIRKNFCDRACLSGHHTRSSSWISSVAYGLCLRGRGPGLILLLFYAQQSKIECVLRICSGICPGGHCAFIGLVFNDLCHRLKLLSCHHKMTPPSFPSSSLGTHLRRKLQLPPTTPRLRPSTTEAEVPFPTPKTDARRRRTPTLGENCPIRPRRTCPKTPFRTSLPEGGR